MNRDQEIDDLFKKHQDGHDKMPNDRVWNALFQEEEKSQPIAAAMPKKVETPVKKMNYRLWASLAAMLLILLIPAYLLMNRNFSTSEMASADAKYSKPAQKVMTQQEQYGNSSAKERSAPMAANKDKSIKSEAKKSAPKTNAKKSSSQSTAGQAASAKSSTKPIEGKSNNGFMDIVEEADGQIAEMEMEEEIADNTTRNKAKKSARTSIDKQAAYSYSTDAAPAPTPPAVPAIEDYTADPRGPATTSPPSSNNVPYPITQTNKWLIGEWINLENELETWLQVGDSLMIRQAYIIADGDTVLGDKTRIRLYDKEVKLNQAEAQYGNFDYHGQLSEKQLFLSNASGTATYEPKGPKTILVKRFKRKNRQLLFDSSDRLIRIK